MKRVFITLTDEEFDRISAEAAKFNISPMQFCKELILKTKFDSVKSEKGSFSKNYAIVLADLKSYAKKHSGTFQLRDLKSWGMVTQGSFDGEEIIPVGQNTAIGKAISKAVSNGEVPNVRIATVFKDGKVVPKRDNYGVIIYEILDIDEIPDEDPQLAIDEIMDAAAEEWEKEV